MSILSRTNTASLALILLLVQVISPVFLPAFMTDIVHADMADVWYDTSWSYRKAITIDHTKVPNTDQANFPVLISLTDAALRTQANGGKVQNANGYDIIFADQAGVELDHEIESYDGVNGTINMWVGVSVLSHTDDTILYLYYGNSAIDTSQENKEGVWDSNFELIQHMNQNPGGTASQMIDSTSNSNDGTSYGSMATDDSIAGKVGKGIDFDGSNDSIDVGNGSSLNITGNITVSFWIKSSANNASKRIVTKLDGGSASGYDICFTSSGNGALKFGTNNGGWNEIGASQEITDNTWHYAVFYYDMAGGVNNKRIYYDNSVAAQATYADGMTSNSTTVSVGSLSNAANFFTGSLDEVRISSSARSADWIATEYNNQSNPSTFYTLSSEENNIHHFTLTGSASQTAGGTQTVTLTAKGSLGNNATSYTGDRTITLSGPSTIGSNVPTFTDKNGNPVNFGSSGTVTFTNGVATALITPYKAESISIDATDGTYSSSASTAYDLDLTVSPATLNSFTFSSPASVASESPFSLILTAKDAYGNTTTGVSSAAGLSVSHGIIAPASLAAAEFTDDGSYTGNVTVSQISQNASIVLTVASGAVSNTHNLSVIGVSHGVSLPQKPVIDSVSVSIGNLSNLPDNIIEIAVSRTPDFSNVSWQAFDRDNFSHLKDNTETLYFKFRTDKGATSDVVVYAPQAAIQTINDGDIVKAADSPDVFVIKLINGKKFKRLILSPRVFQSYGHLKWENLKTVSQSRLDQYITSNLVFVQNDPDIYELSPNGDSGQRRVHLGSYDKDIVYEINAVDREGYQLAG